MSSPLGTARQVLRIEGWRALRDRLLDRLAETRRQRSFRPLATAAGGTVPPSLRTPWLHLAPHGPAPRRGGVAVQTLERLEREGRERPVALLYPQGGAHRLELFCRDERRAVTIPEPPAAPTALAAPAWERAVAAAVALTGARALHVETPTGLPPASLLQLARGKLPLVLSLHDFGLFCRRPQLLEHPQGVFCSYSTDLRRCARCLQQDWPLGAADQEEWRNVGRELLRAAEAVIFPSCFLRDTVAELFAAPDLPKAWVVAPATPARPPRRPRRPPWPPRTIAFVGGGAVHKGAPLFAEALCRLGPLAGRARWIVYGGNGFATLHQLRERPEVRVRGYYRNGSLPRLIARDRVDLALLLSIVPETWSLTLSECRLAGVPVLATAVGALPERLAAGGGWTVPPEPAAVAAALAAILAGKTERREGSAADAAPVSIDDIRAAVLFTAPT